MSPPNVQQPSLSVDALFARLHYDRSNGTPPPQAGPSEQAGDGMPAHAELQPPPPLENSADLQAAHEWLQTERARLEAYTRSQFAALQQQHQSLVAKQFRSEESLALRAQELNREMKFLASQSENLQSRAHELGQRETALTVQMERLASVEQELLNNNLQEDPEAHRALLEGLRADTAQLQEAGAGARMDAAAFEAALKERQQAWEQEHGTLIARQAEMDHRFTALEKSEQASQRYLAELDEVELLLRKEFEQQEKRLAQERQEIDILRVRLRTQIRKLEQGVDELEDDAVPV